MRAPLRVGSRPSARTLAWVLAASVSLLVGTPVTWALTRPQIEAGIVPPPVSPALRGYAQPAPEPVTIHPAGPEVPDIEVHSARLEDQQHQKPGPAPVRIRIPAIGVDAAITSMGADPATQTMQVPLDIDVAGWYRYGPLPGDAGSSVLVGHVDSAAEGPGVFFRLREVQPGTEIIVAFGDGSTRRFNAVGRRSYPKSELPSSLFTRAGPPVVSLVTCGGSFNRVTGHYQENVVVYATPRG